MESTGASVRIQRCPAVVATGPHRRAAQAGERCRGGGQDRIAFHQPYFCVSVISILTDLEEDTTKPLPAVASQMSSSWHTLRYTLGYSHECTLL